MPVVVRLTGCHRELDRQAVGIDQRMKSCWSNRRVIGPWIVFCSE